MEQMQKAERFALKKLLEDYKKVVAQRDQLLEKQQDLYCKITDLQESYEMQIKASTEMDDKCKGMEQRFRNLEKMLQEKQLLLNASQNELENYRINCAHFTGVIEEVKLFDNKFCNCKCCWILVKCREIEVRRKRCISSKYIPKIT